MLKAQRVAMWHDWTMHEMIARFIKTAPGISGNEGWPSGPSVRLCDLRVLSVPLLGNMMWW